MMARNATWAVSMGFGTEQTRLSWAPVAGGVTGVVAMVTVLLNGVLLLSILLHEPSRSRSFHLHVVSMAVAALLQGGGVLPLWTHYLMRGDWAHGDGLCRWWLAADCMATTVSALAIVVTACDRFVFLICWRFMKEGGKYIITCLLLFLSWLLALAVTLVLTLMESESGVDGRSGVQVGGQCLWGEWRGERVVAVRLVTYVVGAGFGAGLSVALITLLCAGIGHMLPVDEDEAEIDRRKSLLSAKRRSSAKAPEKDGGVGDDVDDDKDFPLFLIIKKTDRLEERERWKLQVISLLTVAVAWVLLWLPSHLFTLASTLGLQWHVPSCVGVASVLLGYLHAAIMPLLWLLHQPIRLAVTEFFLCRCCRDGDSREEEEDSMEFQDVGPYRPGEVTT